MCFAKSLHELMWHELSQDSFVPFYSADQVLSDLHIAAQTSDMQIYTYMLAIRS